MAFSASSVIVTAREEAAIAKKTNGVTKLREKARHKIMMVSEPTTIRGVARAQILTTKNAFPM